MLSALTVEQLADIVADILKAGRVLADARKVEVAPGTQQVQDILLPVLNWCRERPKAAGRGLVGIAAPPAAGKSIFTAWLNAVAQAAGYGEFAFLSLDGYHLQNTVLDARSLRGLKGTPQTFDAGRLLEDLRALRGGRDEKFLPAYSREIHDPVEKAVRVGPEIAWAFVEGNFLFMDEPPWREIRGLFDRRIFIDADESLLRERLASRHGRAGRDAAWISAHFIRTDGPNIQRAKASAMFADLTLRWADAGTLVGI